MASSKTDKEILIAQALEAYQKTPNLSRISREYGIKRTTLQSRLKGAKPIREAKTPAQTLSLVQEEGLVEWILGQESCGDAPTLVEIRLFARCILENSGGTPIVGKHWVKRFIKRHPEIHTKLGQSLEASRARETTEENLRAFYDRLAYQITSKKIGPSYIINIDEHGLQEGETKAGVVVGSSVNRRVYVKQSDPTPWVSILEAITASGRRLTPVIVFTGENLQGQWFPTEIKDWKYGCTPSGWSNSKIALGWLKDVLLPETKPPHASQWRLLILDGHRTHTPINFQYHAWINKVFLLFLPAHTSQKTQPCDVGLFAPTKKYYHQEMRQFASFDTSAPIQKRRFLEAYAKATELAFTPDNIRGGFRGAGCWPVDPEHAIVSIGGVLTKDPATPRVNRTQRTNEDIWATPKGSKDLARQMGLLRESLEGEDRGVRRVVKKAGKEIDRLAAAVTSLQHEVAHLKAERESKKPTGRKTVEKDPNETFASIEAIKKARDEAERAAERAAKMRSNYVASAVDDAEEIGRMSMKDMMHEFQV